MESRGEGFVLGRESHSRGWLMSSGSSASKTHVVVEGLAYSEEDEGVHTHVYRG